MKIDSRKGLKILLILALTFFMTSCGPANRKVDGPTASDILGNPGYPAISFGGYKHNTREMVPSVEELQEDMKILAAMGIKVLRTYNTQQFPHTAHLLEAIRLLKEEDPGFEMYVMLGTWMECEGAWTASANHKAGNVENNTAEIEAAVHMAKSYPDIVKMIAVGNEAMVQWAVNYFVYPNVIHKWVEYLKRLRDGGEIPQGIWITSSDNYESWGGGATSYQTADLAALINSVDFISLHTYPFHDSHYNPTFWGVPDTEENLPELDQIEAAMLRAKNYAVSQYQGVADYVESLGMSKPIHIGETGWASKAASSYGATGSKAADEYKQKLYYQHMREWTRKAGMSCFYFEAFDEPWKDPGNALGSENHFGLINLKGEAKFSLWDMVDAGVFDGLTRAGSGIVKTYDGDKTKLLAEISPPPLKKEMGMLQTTTVNKKREAGQAVSEGSYVVAHNKLVPDGGNDISYPSVVLKLNAWEGTCGIEMTQDGIVEIVTGTGAWWGCALEVTGGTGENLSAFKSGKLNFTMKGTTSSSFQLGFQTGSFAQGTQVNNFVDFGSADGAFPLTEDWKSYSIRISDLNRGANLEDVTAPLFLRGKEDFDGKEIYLKNIYYSRD